MNDRFRFRETDIIGVPDAESDSEFLEECFIDNGLSALLADCRDKRRIVLGRTGAGKTALLNHLRDNNANAIGVSPESLALTYISNSDILRFVLGLGVNLDVFFRLLWRHVLTVEIIKARFKLDAESGKSGLLEWIKNQFSASRPRHEKALAYLEKWGSTFWEQTDARVTEVTTKLETDLKGAIGTTIPNFNFNFSDEQKISQEQKNQIVSRASNVVNTVQIQELSYVLELLNEVLSDPQKPYYLVIDKLDENWVEEKMRFLLIRALIETARDFFKVQNAKILLCLRYDLIDRVIQETRGPGFQEEKYESLFLDLNWSRAELTNLLDARINKLVRQRYTNQRVTHRDLLPNTVGGKPALEYMLDRTLMRPRDIIVFFNACIRHADGNPVITGDMLKTAEGEYSRSRLNSISDEWSSEYPDLLLFTSVLKGKRETINLSDWTDSDCLDISLALMDSPSTKSSALQAILKATEQNLSNFGSLRRYLAIAFYKVGLVGLKLTAYDGVVWSVAGRRSVSMAEIENETRLQVHPCFWRSLGIRPNSAADA